MQIPLSSIIIEERIRENKKGSETEWREFKESFRQLGQLQAIRVELITIGAVDQNGIVYGEPKYRLVAGERRFIALSELNESGESIPGLAKGMIDAIEKEPMPVRVRLLQEYAENDKRKDFDFVERAKFIRRFHESMQVETGKAKNGEWVWSQELTARTLGLSPSSITQHLKVEQAVRDNPEVAKASTLDAAIKRIKTHEQLAHRHAVAKQDNNSFSRASTILSLGDARVLIRNIADNSVDFINFDPPWGDDVAHKSQENHSTFDDSTEYANELMDALFPELYRILKDDRFLLFWHRNWASESYSKYVEKFGFNHGPSRTPAIWYKPDKTTDQNRVPEKQLIEAYESFFILRKGNPVFYEKQANNVFAFDRVVRGSVVHPTEKPLALCEALISLCTVPGETVFDPTAGSSALLEAAISKGRKANGFELSPTFYERGITRLAERLKTFSES